MTESEWLKCTDPTLMLAFLRGKVSDRKFRLFLVASCRRLFDLFPDLHCREAIKIAERYADCEVSAEKLQFAWRSIRRSSTASRRDFRRTAGKPTALAFVLWLANLTVVPEPVHTMWTGQAYWFLTAAERYGLADRLNANEPALLRDIFGNSLCPVCINPTWLTPTVTSLATAAYDERMLPSGELDAARLAILADALEEVGCENADILTHIRGPGPHVRGCWVVDLLLGKE